MQFYEYSKILEQQVQQKSKLRWMSAMHQKDCSLKKKNQNQTIERNCVMEAFPSVLGFKQLLMVPSLGSRKTCLMLLAETARFSVVDFSMLLIKKQKWIISITVILLLFLTIWVSSNQSHKKKPITVNSWIIPLKSKLSSK